MSVTRATSEDEWRRNWPVALAGFLGMSVMTAPIMGMGMLIKPLTQEFGWSVAEVTTGISLSVMLIIPLGPVVGGMVDRWGARAVALPGLLLAAIGISALSMANGSTSQWLMMWFMIGSAMALISATVWASAISSVFFEARGMALAVTLSGSAFSGTLGPPLAQSLADHYGWRVAFLGFGLGWAGVAFVFNLLFLKLRREPSALSNSRNFRHETICSSNELPGLTIRQAARSVPLIRICFFALIGTGVTGGLSVHKAPMLIELGMSRPASAWLVSLSGLSSAAGLLVGGWATQKWKGSLAGTIGLSISGVAMLFLLKPFATPLSVVLAMMTIGLTGGIVSQSATYLTGIYVGLRNYGKVYGAVVSIMTIGVALGPLLVGVAYDAVGDYSLFIYIAAPISLVCAALLIGLGKHPEWSA